MKETKESIRLKEVRSLSVDFIGWIIEQTQYAKTNAMLKDDFMLELDKKIDVLLYELTKDL